ncbi:hypothetical protein EK21DRAFT_89908 [Setomelanomma holmii]|uniref:Uncharacterized protein n=1 Tax=Setomelanomma holmii TaxID=210430 RepID=A0A9P4LM58_9PLEO|nr:hypothetical protein EK21DRAFT_89908 [Setomelanomma holmii]
MSWHLAHLNFHDTSSHLIINLQQALCSVLNTFTFTISPHHRHRLDPCFAIHHTIGKHHSYSPPHMPSVIHSSLEASWFVFLPPFVVVANLLIPLDQTNIKKNKNKTSNNKNIIDDIHPPSPSTPTSIIRSIISRTTAASDIVGAWIIHGTTRRLQVFQLLYHPHFGALITMHRCLEDRASSYVAYRLRDYLPVLPCGGFGSGQA